MHNFTTEVLHPVTEAIVDCEVTYRVADVGTYREQMHPVIVSVTTPDNEDIADKLDADTVAALEEQASEFYADERNAAFADMEAI